ncbi:MAG: hypothetical protein HOQ05_12375 [Corynebacteriales bacterium]|nr:hypothetical protein [Mycobacteriales bacterium]
MDERHPTLAIGSNAAPAQLESKFALAANISDLVPLTRVTVKGISAGYSAHISKQGYIAYTPIKLDVESTLFMLWLDDAQLAHIHATEPNYVPTTVKTFPAVLESGENIEAYLLYRSKWGAIASSLHGPRAASTQQRIFQFLARSPRLVKLVPELADGHAATVARLAADEDLRTRLHKALGEESFVTPDGLPDEHTMGR